MSKKFNLIFITIDGARQDRLGISKELIDITKKGVYFSQMMTCAPYTLASMHAIFSGMYPTKNGVDAYYSMFKFKKAQCKTLTEYFKEHGYHTKGDFLNDATMPEQGFDEFTVHDENKDDLLVLHKRYLSEMAELKKKGKNFFLYLHYSNIHTETIKNVVKKYSDFDDEYFDNYEKNVENYNGYLINAGIYAKQIYETIDKLGLLKNSLVVFISDHGISNGEKKGERVYGSFLYDYTMKSFAVFIFPESADKGKEVVELTKTIDVMPTLLDFFGFAEDDSYENMQGSSLLPLMKGKEMSKRIAFAETGGLFGPWPSRYKPNVRCVRTNKWKLIHNESPDTWELYDLEKDKSEKKNVIAENSGIGEELKEELNKILVDCNKSKIDIPNELISEGIKK